MPAQRVRIPADVDRDDQILAGLSARQLAILAVAAIALWGLYVATRGLVPQPVFAALALPVAAVAGMLALGRRDGLTFPARALEADGVVDLGGDGSALVCSASSLNFGLRTDAEQQALVAAFGRCLNAVTAPVQIVVRAQRADLRAVITDLTDAAPGLPHPALEAAAREHATFLADLAARRDALARQVLLVLHAPHPAAVAEQALRRRAEELRGGLAATGITVTVLDGGEAAAVLAAATASPEPTHETPAAPTTLDRPVGVAYAAGGAAGPRRPRGRPPHRARRRQCVPDAGGDRIPAGGRPRLAGAVGQLPRHGRRRCARRAGAAAGRRRPAAPSARPDGVHPPRRRRPRPPGRPERRGRRRGRPRPGRAPGPR